MQIRRARKCRGLCGGCEEEGGYRGAAPVTGQDMSSSAQATRDILYFGLSEYHVGEDHRLGNQTELGVDTGAVIC